VFPKLSIDDESYSESKVAQARNPIVTDPTAQENHLKMVDNMKIKHVTTEIDLNVQKTLVERSGMVAQPAERVSVRGSVYEPVKTQGKPDVVDASTLKNFQDVYERTQAVAQAPGKAKPTSGRQPYSRA
jgi:hypothetical protein